MKKLFLLLCLLCFGSPALAWWHGGGPANVINLGGNQQLFPWINFAKGLLTFTSTAGYNFPAILDDNGYPTSTPANQLAANLRLPASYSGHWIIKWSGTGRFQLSPNNGSGLVVDSSGSCIWFAHANILFPGGTDCRVEWHWTSIASSVNFVIENSGTFSGLSNLRICRVADEAACDAGTVLNPDFTALLTTIRPLAIRTMDWQNSNGENTSGNWASRPNTNYISWQASSTQWRTGLWAGDTSGSATYTIAAPPGWPGLIAGAKVQVRFVSANTASPTLNVGGTGDIALASYSGTNITAVGAIPANTLATLEYDSILNRWLYKTGGDQAGTPIEALVSSANTINTDLWLIAPCHANDDYITQAVTYVRDNLRSERSLYLEYCNEVWNGGVGFFQTPWAAASGTALGLTADGIKNVYGFYGLKTAQFANLARAAWSPRSASQLHPVLMGQLFSPVGNTQPYRYNGQELCGTSCGNATYQAIIGTDYNAAPNRPIDLVDYAGYATYFEGEQYRNADATFITHCTAECIAAADNYALGTPSGIDAAFQFLNNDARGPNANQENLTSVISQANSYNTILAAYPKRVVQYEGGFQPLLFPAAGDCTTMGIDAAYCGASGKFALMMAGFKNSNYMLRLTIDWHNQFKIQSQALYSSWYDLDAASQWSVLPGDLYSTPFQSYYGLKAVNGAP